MGQASDLRPGDSRGALRADRLVEVAAACPGVVSVNQLAEAMSMSTRALRRCSTLDWHRCRSSGATASKEATLRLRVSHELTVDEVATALGYADQSHLAAHFRSMLGLIACDYRCQLHP